MHVRPPTEANRGEEHGRICGEKPRAMLSMVEGIRQQRTLLLHHRIYILDASPVDRVRGWTLLDGCSPLRYITLAFRFVPL
jgi:hypothetical protein